MADKKYLDKQGLQTYTEDLTQKYRGMFAPIETASNSPVFTDTPTGWNTKFIYVYTGTTEGSYISGHMYQYNSASTSWADIGQYGGVRVDSTLSNQGQAADAKATGDRFAEDESEIQDIKNNIIHHEDYTQIKFCLETNVVETSETIWQTDISYVWTAKSFVEITDPDAFNTLSHNNNGVYIGETTSSYSQNHWYTWNNAEQKWSDGGAWDSSAISAVYTNNHRYAYESGAWVDTGNYYETECTYIDDHYIFSGTYLRLQAGGISDNATTTAGSSSSGYSRIGYLPSNRFYFQADSLQKLVINIPDNLYKVISYTSYIPGSGTPNIIESYTGHSEPTIIEPNSTLYYLIAFDFGNSNENSIEEGIRYLNDTEIEGNTPYRFSYLNEWEEPRFVATSQDISNANKYLYIDETGKVVPKGTNTELNTPNVAADSKAVGDAFDDKFLSYNLLIPNECKVNTRFTIIDDKINFTTQNASSRICTNFIPVSAGQYISHNIPRTNTQQYAILGEDKETVISSGNFYGRPILVSNDIRSKYIVLQFLNPIDPSNPDDNFIDRCMINHGYINLSYLSNSQKTIRRDILYPFLDAFNTNNVIKNANEGTAIQIDVPNIKKNYTISYAGFFTNFSDLTLCQQKYATQSSSGSLAFTNTGRKLVIDGTYVKLYYSPNSNTPNEIYEHHLTIADYIIVNLVVDNDTLASATLNIFSGAGSFSQSGISWRYAQPDVFVQHSGGDVWDNTLTFGSPDFYKRVWMFGDSYFDHWVPILLQKGYTEFLVDGFTGRQSKWNRAGDQELLWCALKSFYNDIKYGTPQKIIWCMGMNDIDSNDSPNANWLDAILTVSSWCEIYGVEFIPTTIPNVPNAYYSNTYKNEYIRENFSNYIDLAKLLGNRDGDSTWYSGLLYSDNLHPSTAGDRYIADIMETYLSETKSDSPNPDKTLTISGAAADAKATGDRLHLVENNISELKNNEDILFTDRNIRDLWEQGTVLYNTGRDTGSAVTIRSTYLPSNICTIDIDDGYRFGLYAYSILDNTYIGVWNGNEWISTSYQYLTRKIDMRDIPNHTSYKFRVILQYVGNTSTPASIDVDSTWDKMRFIAITDSILSNQGQAADAKAAGDRLAEIQDIMFDSTPIEDITTSSVYTTLPRTLVDGKQYILTVTTTFTVSKALIALSAAQSEVSDKYWLVGNGLSSSELLPAGTYSYMFTKSSDYKYVYCTFNRAAPQDVQLQFYGANWVTKLELDDVKSNISSIIPFVGDMSNRFNPDDIKEGYRLSSDCRDFVASDYFITGFIPVDEGTDICVPSIFTTGTSYNMCFYTDAFQPNPSAQPYTFVQSFSVASTTHPYVQVTVPATAHYVRITGELSDIANFFVWGGSSYIYKTMTQHKKDEVNYTVIKSSGDVMPQSRPDCTYAAFCSGIYWKGKEIYAFRSAQGHLTWHNTSTYPYGDIIFCIKEDNTWKYIVPTLSELNPSREGELRDPNLTVSRDGETFFLSCFTTVRGTTDNDPDMHTSVLYNFGESSFHKDGTVHSISGCYISMEPHKGAWGPTLQTPEGYLLHCLWVNKNDNEYPRTTQLYKSTEIYSGDLSNTEFNVIEFEVEENTYSPTLFGTDLSDGISGSTPSECSIGYYRDKLVALCRYDGITNTSTPRLSRIRITEDAEGETNWSDTKQISKSIHSPFLSPYCNDGLLFFGGSEETSSSIRVAIAGYVDPNTGTIWSSKRFPVIPTATNLPNLNYRGGYPGIVQLTSDEFAILWYQEIDGGNEAQNVQGHTNILYRHFNKRTDLSASYVG